MRHREISSRWRAKDKVQTIISTNVMISATIYHPPPATCLPVPGTCNSASLWIEHPGAYMGAYSQVRLGVYFKACSGVSLRASWELTWERTVKQAGSMASSAIGSVLRAYLGTYSRAGWECAIECNWECHLKACSGVYLRASWELTWERTVKQAGSMPSSAIGSVLRAYLGTYSQGGWEYAIEWNCERLESLLGNVQPSRLGVCHRVQLRASWEPTWESKSSRLGVYNRVQSGVYFRAYLGACKKGIWQLCWMQHV